LFNALALARVIGGAPIGRHRAFLAALSYGIFVAALFSVLGWAGGDAVRAL